MSYSTRLQLSSNPGGDPLEQIEFLVRIDSEVTATKQQLLMEQKAVYEERRHFFDDLCITVDLEKETLERGRDAHRKVQAENNKGQWIRQKLDEFQRERQQKRQIVDQLEQSLSDLQIRKSRCEEQTALVHRSIADVCALIEDQVKEMPDIDSIKKNVENVSLHYRKCQSSIDQIIAEKQQLGALLSSLAKTALTKDDISLERLTVQNLIINVLEKQETASENLAEILDDLCCHENLFKETQHEVIQIRHLAKLLGVLTLSRDQANGDHGIMLIEANRKRGRIAANDAARTVVDKENIHYLQLNADLEQSISNTTIEIELRHAKISQLDNDARSFEQLIAECQKNLREQHHQYLMHHQQREQLQVTFEVEVTSARQALQLTIDSQHSPLSSMLRSLQELKMKLAALRTRWISDGPLKNRYEHVHQEVLSLVEIHGRKMTEIQERRSRIYIEIEQLRRARNETVICDEAENLEAESIACEQQLVGEQERNLELTQLHLIGVAKSNAIYAQTTKQKTEIENQRREIERIKNEHASKMAEISRQREINLKRCSEQAADQMPIPIDLVKKFSDQKKQQNQIFQMELHQLEMELSKLNFASKTANLVHSNVDNQPSPAINVKKNSKSKKKVLSEMPTEEHLLDMWMM